MTTAAPPSSKIDHHETEKAKSASYGKAPGKFHFALRRVHSLMGLAFGGYIAVHLSVNAAGFSPTAYQGYVNHIHNLEPALPIIELITIFIPIIVHALYGIYISWAGVKFNTTKYHYLGNLRYTLQRWTAVVLLLFLAFHIGTLHKWGLKGVHNLIEHVHQVPDPLPVDDNRQIDYSKLDALQRFSMWCDDNGGLFGPDQAYQTTVKGVRNVVESDADNPSYIGKYDKLVMAFYLLGIWSATFHFANGLWTSAIAWGLTTTARAQKRSRRCGPSS